MVGARAQERDTDVLRIYRSYSELPCDRRRNTYTLIASRARSSSSSATNGCCCCCCCNGRCFLAPGHGPSWRENTAGLRERPSWIFWVRQLRHYTGNASEAACAPPQGFLGQLSCARLAAQWWTKNVFFCDGHQPRTVTISMGVLGYGLWLLRMNELIFLKIYRKAMANTYLFKVLIIF